MGWNKGLAAQAVGEKSLAFTLPNNRGTGLRLSTTGPQRPYRGGWSVERAITEAYERVTWVYRAVDSIASDQASLKWVMRNGDPDNGEPIDRHEVSNLLNSSANVLEDAWAFRYRLSGQVLLSPRGAFVEQIRSNSGALIGLQLLPPQFTRPVPDVEKGVAEFEVDIPGMDEPERIPADRVLWIRKPHLLDPYGASTPLEALGVAVDMDWIARVFNRNFLANDGRPGGLVVVRGTLGREDREELQARFRGNTATAGRVSVIGSEGGADFVDTAITPRDAQYSDLRNLNKDEILVGFGTDEAILGNASSRTLENVQVAKEVYWEGTMFAHCGLISRPFDRLDNAADIYSGFDFSTVPVLRAAKAKREKEAMEQFTAGVISLNEWRIAVGKRPVSGGDFIYSVTAGGTKIAIAMTDDRQPGSFEVIYLSDPAAKAAAAAASAPQKGVEVHNHYTAAPDIPADVEAPPAPVAEAKVVPDPFV